MDVALDSTHILPQLTDLVLHAPHL
jgi:hypothetical protein